MTVEVEFPIEFLVFGTPLSLGAKRVDSKVAWRERVRRASSAVLPEGHFCSASPISVTLFYFPVAEMEGDVDNIVKPILDAMCKHVYFDDKQVERVLVQKFEPGRIFQFGNPSRALAGALGGEKPLVYIRLSDNPTEGLS